jgi:uncharacterized membrane protein
MPLTFLTVSLYALQMHLSFPQGAANEQIALRWLHITAGIIWIGLLYFFNLIGFPTMRRLEGPVRVKVIAEMMPRAMWWFRWSALVTVVMGLRYYWVLLASDARNAGDPTLVFRWFGEWLLVWLVAYALIYPFQLPAKGVLNSPWVRVIAIAAISLAAAWVILDLNGGPQSSNADLAIAIGGGLGLLMLLNTWGVVWRAQKRLIAWARVAAEQGTPMPPEADRLTRWIFLTARTGFWMSFPMLFLMGAAEHYPFLSGIVN